MSPPHSIRSRQSVLFCPVRASVRRLRSFASRCADWLSSECVAPCNPRRRNLRSKRGSVLGRRLAASVLVASLASIGAAAFAQQTVTGQAGASPPESPAGTHAGTRPSPPGGSPGLQEGPEHATAVQSQTASRNDPGAAIRVGPDAALLVIDMQNCFVEGGTLPVRDARAIIPLINALGMTFDNVIITQDWHTPGHVSFASSHDGKRPFETIKLPYGDQVLWPDHCVQGTHDADLVDGLDLPHAQLVVRKGYHRGVDSYSAFQEADRRTPTGLDGYLKQRRIKRLFMVGLATDYCVAWTAVDARIRGYQTWVVEDATRAIDLNGSLDAAWKRMKDMGVRRIESSRLVATGEASP